jgi:hypothetical protein
MIYSCLDISGFGVEESISCWLDNSNMTEHVGGGLKRPFSPYLCGPGETSSGLESFHPHDKSYEPQATFGHRSERNTHENGA